MTPALLLDPLDVARFWSKVAVGRPGVCWEWRAARNELGYGVFRAPGGRRNTRAHRTAWAIANGREPGPDEKLMHACDNPPCCNPAHLSPGTQADNIADMVAKGRQRGSRNSRLSAKDLIAIRAGASAGRTHQSLAEEFGISASYVSMLIASKRWRSEGTK